MRGDGVKRATVCQGVSADAGECDAEDDDDDDADGSNEDDNPTGPWRVKRRNGRDDAGNPSGKQHHGTQAAAVTRHTAHTTHKTYLAGDA